MKKFLFCIFYLICINSYACQKEIYEYYNEVLYGDYTISFEKAETAMNVIKCACNHKYYKNTDIYEYEQKQKTRQGRIIYQECFNKLYKGR